MLSRCMVVHRDVYTFKIEVQFLGLENRHPSLRPTERKKSTINANK